jgi:hypothetical protein
LPTQIAFCPLLFSWSSMFHCCSMLHYSIAQIAILSLPLFFYVCSKFGIIWEEAWKHPS